MEVRVYGQKQGTYKLYDDDGQSLDYEKGAFDWRTIRIEKDTKGQLKGVVEAAHNKNVQSYNKITFRFMSGQ
ncbi:DUF5110 domain-containing protein [Niabella sp. W65]|nr:DUF5110 domain-containing protein [Niabella sp. W65]MCH7366243.1 DUF5110 domain-containing protein [Niabella sp. W65]ULT46648.1 DUF5110 domain-containing protein [Niabella sp. I65]